MWLLDAFENLPADAYGGFIGIDLFHFENPFRIVFAVFPAQLVAALRNPAHAPPTSIRHLKHAIDQFARRHIAIAIEDARVLVFEPPRSKTNTRASSIAMAMCRRANWSIACLRCRIDVGGAWAGFRRAATSCAGNTANTMRNGFSK